MAHGNARRIAGEQPRGRQQLQGRIALGVVGDGGDDTDAKSGFDVPLDDVGHDRCLGKGLVDPRAAREAGIVGDILSYRDLNQCGPGMRELAMGAI